MATAKYDSPMMFDTYSPATGQNFAFCKSEAARGASLDNSSPIDCRNNCQRRVNISSDGYYGRWPLQGGVAQDRAAREMDCDMTPIVIPAQHPPARKRCHDDVNFGNYKRFRKEEFVVPIAPEPRQPQMTHYARPTHANPDISRCLMAHMI